MPHASAAHTSSPHHAATQLAPRFLRPGPGAARVETLRRLPYDPRYQAGGRSHWRPIIMMADLKTYPHHSTLLIRPSVRGLK